MTSAKKHEWLRFDTVESVAMAVRDEIVSAAENAISERGTFKIVLAGGTTPERIYRLLAQEKCDWENWQIYLGDERCLPIGDKDRNSTMICECLLDQLDIPYENVHLMPADLGAEQGATAYQSEIQHDMPFDMVLLGMGEDGHTASLFPGHEHNEAEWVHAVHNSPKPPPDRVTLSVTALSNSHHVIMIITGDNKQLAVKRWCKGEDLPIARIGSFGTLKVMLDKAAYGE